MWEDIGIESPRWKTLFYTLLYALAASSFLLLIEEVWLAAATEPDQLRRVFSVAGLVLVAVSAGIIFYLADRKRPLVVHLPQDQKPKTRLKPSQFAERLRDWIDAESREEELLRRALKQLATDLGAQSAVYLEAISDRELSSPSVSHGQAINELLPQFNETERLFFPERLITESPVVIPDLGSAPRDLCSPALHEAGFRSLLFVHVRSEDSLIGVLGLLTDETWTPSLKELRYAQSAASWLAFEIERLAERRMQRVLTQVAARLLASENKEAGIQATLQTICVEGEFSAGEYWAAGQDPQHLKRLDEWQDLSISRPVRRMASKKARIQKGEGLIGETWSTGQVRWSQGLSEATGSENETPAVRPMLGFGIPVRPSQDEHKSLGVLAFYALDSRRVSPSRTRTLDRIGCLLGDFVQRQDHLLNLAEREEHYRSVAEDALGQTEVALAIVDSRRDVAWVSPTFADAFGITPEQVVGAPAQVMFNERIASAVVDGEDLAERVLASYRVDEYLDGVEVQLVNGQAAGDKWLEYWSRPILRGKYEGGRADYLVNITRRKHIEEEARHQSEQQAAVAELARQALAELDLDRLLDVATERAQTTLGVESVELLLMDESGDSLTIEALAGDRSEDLVGSSMPIDKSNELGYALFSSGPVKVENYELETRFEAAPYLAEPPRSGVVLMLQGRTSSHGVLAAHSTQTKRFSTHDVAFLDALATVIAHAFEREKAEEDLQGAREELEHRVDVRTQELRRANAALESEIRERRRAETSARASLRVSQKLTQTLNVTEILEGLLQQSADLVGAFSGTAGLWVEEEARSVIHLEGDELRAAQDDPAPISELAQWVLKNRRSYLIEDANEDPLLNQSNGARESITSALGQPILTGRDELLGFIEVHRKQGSEEFTDFDREQLNLISQVASAALQNALAYGKLQEAEEELSRSKQQLEHAQELARLGSWKWNLETEELVWSDELYRIYGLDPKSDEVTYEMFMELVHPEDREWLQERINQAYRDHEPFQFEHRIITPEGNPKILEGRGQVVTDSTGKPVSMHGTGQDITGSTLMKQALERQRQLYESLLEAQSDLGLGVIVSEDDEIIYMNQAFSRISGFEPDELNSIDEVLDLVHDPDPETVRAYVRSVQEGQSKAPHQDMTLRDKADTLHHVEFSIKATTSAERIRNFMIFRDVTRRHQDTGLINSLLSISKRLNASLELPELLDTMVREALELADVESGLVAVRQGEAYVAQGYVKNADKHEAELRLGAEDEFAERLQRVKRPFTVPVAELHWGPRPRSKELDIQTATYAPILDREGELLGFFELHDMNNEEDLSRHDQERLEGLSQIASIALQNGLAYEQLRQAQERLRSSEARLRQFSQHLEEVQERERARISREIHDELGQALTGLKMDTVWLRNQLQRIASDAPVERLEKKTSGMAELIDSTIQVVRDIATELRPSVLDDLGLIAAIEWQVGEFTRRTDIQCSLTTNVEQLDVDPRVASGAFRILQEALTNAARHSQASQVRVRLKDRGEEIQLQVEDNGVGMEEFDLQESQSLGIMGMWERAHLLNGNLQVETEPGKGTKLTIRLPYNPEEDEMELLS